MVMLALSCSSTLPAVQNEPASTAIQYIEKDIENTYLIKCWWPEPPAGDDMELHVWPYWEEIGVAFEECYLRHNRFVDAHKKPR